MRTFTRPIDLARHKEAQLRRMFRGFHQEFEKIVNESLQDGIDLTGGSVTSKQLKELGHPFGRGPRANTYPGGGLKRGSRTKIPNLPINQQSGRLRRGWYVRLEQRGQGRRVYRLGNTAGHAKYILSPWGTRKMVGRGIWGSPRYTGVQGLGRMARLSRARIKALTNVMRRKRF